jgi:hypothetical protein
MISAKGTNFRSVMEITLNRPGLILELTPTYSIKPNLHSLPYILNLTMAFRGCDTNNG